MEELKIPKYRTIDEQSAKEFDDALNQAVEDLAEFEPKVTFLDKFCARIEFYPREKIKVIVKTVRDEFRLDGVYYHCRNCPYLEVPDDRRVKWGKCKYASSGLSHKNHEACEFFYKQVKQNAVDVIEDSDLLLW